MSDKSSVKELPLPTQKTLMNAAKFAMMDDMPIMLDYWSDSMQNQVFIGIKDNQEKLLVKSEEEYTSNIKKIFKVENDYIIMTENSIYIVSTTIATRKVSHM
tara:strand:+ start:240 stop:545 length:306 start_codon:yes stop_codon:yes gene_type:complete